MTTTYRHTDRDGDTIEAYESNSGDSTPGVVFEMISDERLVIIKKSEVPRFVSKVLEISGLPENHRIFGILDEMIKEANETGKRERDLESLATRYAGTSFHDLEYSSRELLEAIVDEPAKYMFTGTDGSMLPSPKLFDTPEELVQHYVDALPFMSNEKGHRDYWANRYKIVKVNDA